MFAAAGLFGLRQIFAVPRHLSRPESLVITQIAGSALASALEPLVAQHSGLDGIYTLRRGEEAFAARALLARAASVSIDAQYYIWHHDLSGTLLLNELLHAADRGVRVRLLIDDNTTGGQDRVWQQIDAHPQIEVRLFNPFTIRRLRFLNFLTDFFRLNRRMHNKSFTVDNQVTIVGGRNVGDEYFSAARLMQYSDLDVMVVGAVAQDVSAQFDHYWSSISAHPIENILKPVESSALSEYRAQLKLKLVENRSAAYADILRETVLIDQLLAGTLTLEWMPARLVVDPPVKGLRHIANDKLLATQILSAFRQTKIEICLTSAYFVPARAGTRIFCALARRGCKVRILTNSLSSNEVLPVQAGYARYRRKLIKAGVDLFEFKSEYFSPVDSLSTVSPEKWFGASRASLHAKMFTLDRSRVFVGSFNFDPRSIYLNCEMGIFLESESLAGEVAKVFDMMTELQSFHPKIDANEKLIWTDPAGDSSKIYTVEPRTGFLARLYVGIIALLPIEWLL